MSWEHKAPLAGSESGVTGPRNLNFVVNPPPLPAEHPQLSPSREFRVSEFLRCTIKPHSVARGGVQNSRNSLEWEIPNPREAAVESGPELGLKQDLNPRVFP